MADWQFQTVTMIVRYDAEVANEPTEWNWSNLADDEVRVLNGWPTEVAELMEVDAFWPAAKDEIDRLADIAESKSQEWAEERQRDDLARQADGFG